ncbi:MAG: hypothetical protein PUJ72_04650 [Eubacteriales bacterium]|nr:hypothetical protein [Eubacterium sp.]MDD7573525.1 hypothetical protein [Eubacteriales bacterium]MDY5356126.1 hypothetical protein [Eubacteriales bacterium]
MKRIFSLFLALLLIFTLFSVISLAVDSESGTQSETVTDRADDPASYDTPQGRKVQLYIIVALFAFGLVMVVVMIIKNYVASK